MDHLPQDISKNIPTSIPMLAGEHIPTFSTTTPMQDRVLRGRYTDGVFGGCESCWQRQGTKIVGFAIRVDAL